LQLPRHNRKSAGPGQKALAAACVVVVLFVSLLAANPSLHRWFHPDADRPDHECAVTIFSHSQVLPAAAGAVAVAIATGVVFFVRLPEVTVFVSPLLRLPPSCGPPVPSV
jgi:hypothetical protein